MFNSVGCSTNLKVCLVSNYVFFILSPALQQWDSWSIWNFPCSLTRNVTSHSMKNLSFYSLPRWKVIILPILNTSLIHFESVLFREWKVLSIHTPLVCSYEVLCCQETRVVPCSSNKQEVIKRMNSSRYIWQVRSVMIEFGYSNTITGITASGGMAENANQQHALLREHSVIHPDRSKFLWRSEIFDRERHITMAAKIRTKHGQVLVGSFERSCTKISYSLSRFYCCGNERLRAFTTKFSSH